MQVTRLMSRKEWDAFQDGKILINDTDHYKDGKGGSLSVGFCFTEDSPEDAWVYLAGVVDAAVCVTFDFPDGYLRKSCGVYADHSEGAKFEDRVLKTEWCCEKYHRSIAKVVDVIDPFKGDGYGGLTGWRCCVAHYNDIQHWAYINDLLPKTKEL